MKRIILGGFRFVLIAGATAALALVETGEWAHPPEWVTWLSVLVLAVGAGAPAVVATRAASKLRANHAAAKQARDAFRVALKLVAQRSGIGFERLGFNCLLVPRWYRVLMPRKVRKRLFGWLKEERKVKLPGQPVLQSVEKFRIEEDPPPSGIEWTRGKGIIGRCWQKREIVGLNVPKEYGPYSEMDRAAWEAAAPPGVRLGLDYGEWKQVANRYSAVLVAPILVRGEFWGCVTLDTPMQQNDPDDRETVEEGAPVDDEDERPTDYELLWTKGVREALIDAALYTSKFLDRESL